MRSTIIRTVALAALAGATLAGCGDDKASKTAAEPGFTEKTVAEIQTAAVEDMKAATSLRVTGEVESGDKTTTIDLALTTDGSCDGTMSAGTGTASIRGVGGASYLKADEEFWKSAAGEQASMMIAMIGDKWAKLPSGGDEFSSFCDLDAFFKDLDDDEMTNEKVGATKEIDGIEAIEVVGDDSGGTESVWVSTADPHYILAIEKVGGTEPGHFTFSHFNEAFDITAPPADEVVDLSAM